MTKANMIEEIQKKEAALWLEIALYDDLHAPITTNVSEQIAYDCNDEGRQRHLNAWNAMYELMQSLGIDTNYDLHDHKWAAELHSDLFWRRQAASDIATA